MASRSDSKKAKESPVDASKTVLTKRSTRLSSSAKENTASNQKQEIPPNKKPNPVPKAQESSNNYAFRQKIQRSSLNEEFVYMEALDPEEPLETKAKNKKKNGGTSKEAGDIEEESSDPDFVVKRAAATPDKKKKLKRTMQHPCHSTRKKTQLNEEPVFDENRKSKDAGANYLGVGLNPLMKIEFDEKEEMVIIGENKELERKQTSSMRLSVNQKGKENLKRTAEETAKSTIEQKRKRPKIKNGNENKLSLIEKKRDTELEQLKRVDNLLKKKAEKKKNKGTFSMLYLQKAREKRDELQASLNSITEEFGEFIRQVPEPVQPLTTWDYVLKDIQETHQFITNWASFQKSTLKKISKRCVAANGKREQMVVLAEEERAKRLRDTAKNMSKLVLREFWGNCKKIIRFRKEKIEAVLEKENKTKKLNELLEKQLQLSENLAEMLAESNLPKETSQRDASDEHSIGDMEIVKGEASDAFVWNLKTWKEEEKEKYAFVGYESHSKKPKWEEKDEPPHGSFQHFQKFINEIPVYAGHPFLVRGRLRSYQLHGVRWLGALHDKGVNGILADEMGLGKTIQAISFLAELAGGKGMWGPHLIVVPTSLLINWENELKKWLPSFKVMTYFGRSEERKAKRKGWTSANAFNVCITSYRIAMVDQSVFRRKRWHYLILDEAQQVKNFKSQTWRTLASFYSERRLMLTGTPLQNDVSELWSLMHFLMPGQFESHNDFQDWFSAPVAKALAHNESISKTIIENLQKVLRPLILRRLKRDVEKQLPHKTEYVIRAGLSRKQRFLYDEFVNLQSRSYNSSTDDFMGVMKTLMCLRKVCNHPYLIEGAQVKMPFLCEVIVLHFCSKAFLGDSINKTRLALRFCDLVSGLKTGPDAEAPLFFDAYQKVMSIEAQICGLDFSHFSSKPKLVRMIGEQERIMRNFQSSFVKINSKKSTLNQFLILKLSLTPKLLPKLHFEKEALWKSGDYEELLLKEFVFLARRVIALTPKMVLSNFSSQQHSEESQLSDAYFSTQLNSFAHEWRARQTMEFPNKKDVVYDSGKLVELMNLLYKIRAEGRSHKCLIFTQMSRMLDIIEAALSLHGMTYVRLDGATRTEKRQMVVDKFNFDDRIFCFISSTRSGGVGLNLTAADTVIFYDTDWNPSHDLQAQDRCHRIGQTRDVRIFRLISEYTIEENILQKSRQKQELDQFIMEEGNFNIETFRKVKPDSQSKPLFDFVKLVVCVTSSICLLDFQRCEREQMKMKDFIGESLGFRTHENLENVDFTQYSKALKNVEDIEDVAMGKKAIQESSGQDKEGQVGNGDDEEVGLINIEDEDELDPDELIADLPPIIGYGIKQTEAADIIGDDQENQSQEEDDERESREDQMEEEDPSLQEKINSMEESEAMEKKMGGESGRRLTRGRKKGKKDEEDEELLERGEWEKEEPDYRVTAMEEEEEKGVEQEKSQMEEEKNFSLFGSLLKPTALVLPFFSF